MIIVAGNKKGGVGKSTTVVNLAGAIIHRAIRQGKSTKNLVCIVDADTNESIANYIGRREAYNEKLKEAGLPELEYINVQLRKPDMALTRDLNALSEIYEYVLVDTGGYENIAFKSSLGVCDMVYLPFQPAQMDIEQLVPTLYVINQIEQNVQASVNPDFEIDARLLLTNVESQSRDLFIEAKDSCKQLLEYASISGCAIPHTKAITQIQGRGLTLSDPLPANLKKKELPTSTAKLRPHPKRSAFDLLLDEIDGNRDIEFKRNSALSDASDNAK